MTFVADLLIEFKEEVSEEEKAAIIEALMPKAMCTLNRFGAVLAGDDE